MLTNNLSEFLEPFIEIREYCLCQLNENTKHFETINSDTIGDQKNQQQKNAILAALILEKKICVLQFLINLVDDIERSCCQNHTIHQVIQNTKTNIESIVWLLQKVKKTEGNLISKVWRSVEESCASDELIAIQSFADIETENLQNYLSLECTESLVSEYALKLGLKGNDESEKKSCVVKIDSLEYENSVKIQRDESLEVKAPVKELYAREKPGNDNFAISTIKGVNKESLELYMKTQQELQQNQLKFTDDSFPPELKSITSSLERFPVAKDLVWRRIPEVYNDRQLTLCSEQISSNDVVQGRLRNCYFLSTLCVLAKNHYLIERLFESKEVMSTGCYSIWLCDSGEWKNIILDDYIPCVLSKRTGKPKPYFSRIRGNDIWVCLLEKAFAKLFGSYFGLQGGFQAEAYYALTGAPVKGLHKSSSVEKLWTFITENLAKNHVLTCSCDEIPEVDTKAQGLAVYHSYALLDAKEVDVGLEKKKERVIKIKNPWGYNHWKGRWGDNSSCWTAEAKEVLEYDPTKKVKDGVFWIGLEDLNHYFQHFNACQANESYKYSFLKLGKKNEKQNYFVLKMKLLSAGHVYLTVQQKSKRHFRGANVNYQYSYIRFILAKRTEGKITKLLQGKYDLVQAVFLEQKLQKGNYLIFIEMEWTQDFHHEIVLTSYSDTQPYFYPQSAAEFPLPGLYSDIFSKYIYAVKESKANKYQYKKMQMWRYDIKKFGLGIILYQNKEKSFDLFSSLDLGEIKNMDLVVSSQERSSDSFDLIIPNQSDCLLIFKANRTEGKENDYAFNYKESEYQIPAVAGDENIKNNKARKNFRIESSAKAL